MNYLAHLFLSQKKPSITLGNFLGDIVKVKNVPKLPKDIQLGIELHRKIDEFTDQHPFVKQAVSLIQPHQGRYAAVAVDIYFDFFLCQNWNKYSQETLDDFSEWCNKLIIGHLELVPQKYKAQVQLMTNHNWLKSYSDLGGLHYTFMKVKQRAKFENKFELATVHLEQNQEKLNHNFNNFFPELLEMCRDFVAKT